MSVESNKALVIAYYQVFNEGEDSRFAEFIAEDFIDHNGFPGQISGPEGVQTGYRLWCSAFPDTSATIEDIIGEGDRVVVRTIATATHQGEFFGIQPTDKCIEIEGISIFRIVNNRIQERWGLTEAEKLTRILQEQ